MRKIPPKTYDQTEFKLILDEIDTRLKNLERAINATPFTVSGATGLRQLDVATATPQQVADFVATLISDLRKAGRVF